MEHPSISNILSQENEKHSVEKLQKLREQIEDMNKQIQIARQNYDLEKASELQYGELPKLQKQLEIEEERVHKEDMRLVHESVTKTFEGSRGLP